MQVDEQSNFSALRLHQQQTGHSQHQIANNFNSFNDSSEAPAQANEIQVLELNILEAASLGYFRYSPIVSVIITIGYTMVFIIGIVGNSFVVCIVCKSPRMRTVTNYFIANLALADILVLLLCLPATLIGNLFIPYVLGLVVCKTVSYLQGVAVSASINTMVAVTIDRFLAICFPMDWHMSRRVARRVIACIWLFSLAIALPWAIYFNLVAWPMNQDSQPIAVCAEDWPSETWGRVYFVGANLIMLYLLPAAAITICYLGIWYKIERRNIPGDRPKGLKIELIMQKSKLKVIKMMMVVVLFFLVSWLPTYLLFARLKLFPAANRAPWEDWLIDNGMPLAQWLGASNSCINPILYTFFNRKYKRGFADLLKFVFCCRPLIQDVTNSSSSAAHHHHNHHHHRNHQYHRHTNHLDITGGSGNVRKLLAPTRATNQLLGQRHANIHLISASDNSNATTNGTLIRSTKTNDSQANTLAPSDAISHKSQLSASHCGLAATGNGAACPSPSAELKVVGSKEADAANALIVPTNSSTVELCSCQPSRRRRHHHCHHRHNHHNHNHHHHHHHRKRPRSRDSPADLAGGRAGRQESCAFQEQQHRLSGGSLGVEGAGDCTCSSRSHRQRAETSLGYVSNAAECAELSRHRRSSHDGTNPKRLDNDKSQESVACERKCSHHHNRGKQTSHNSRHHVQHDRLKHDKLQESSEKLISGANFSCSRSAEHSGKIESVSARGVTNQHAVSSLGAGQSEPNTNALHQMRSHCRRKLKFLNFSSSVKSQQTSNTSALANKRRSLNEWRPGSTLGLFECSVQSGSGATHLDVGHSSDRVNTPSSIALAGQRESSPLPRDGQHRANYSDQPHDPSPTELAELGGVAKKRKRRGFLLRGLGSNGAAESQRAQGRRASSHLSGSTTTTTRDTESTDLTATSSAIGPVLNHSYCDTGTHKRCSLNCNKILDSSQASPTSASCGNLITGQILAATSRAQRYVNSVEPEHDDNRRASAETGADRSAANQPAPPLALASAGRSAHHPPEVGASKRKTNDVPTSSRGVGLAPPLGSGKRGDGDTDEAAESEEGEGREADYYLERDESELRARDMVGADAFEDPRARVASDDERSDDDDNDPNYEEEDDDDNDEDEDDDDDDDEGMLFGSRALSSRSSSPSSPSSSLLRASASDQNEPITQSSAPTGSSLVTVVIHKLNAVGVDRRPSRKSNKRSAKKALAAKQVLSVALEAETNFCAQGPVSSQSYQVMNKSGNLGGACSPRPKMRD